MVYKELMIDDIYEIADIACEKVETRELSEGICIVCKYDYAREIIGEAIRYGGYGAEVREIELTSSDWDGYTDEFSIYFTYDEDEGLTVTCEKLKENGNYNYYYGDEVYILEDCNYKIKDYCENGTVFYVYIKDDKCNCEVSPICVTTNNTSDMKTFSFSKNTDKGCEYYSFSTNVDLDYEDIRNLMKNFNLYYT